MSASQIAIGIICCILLYFVGWGVVYMARKERRGKK
jgi:hypothetical protein